MRRVMEPPNPKDHLLEQILSRENMLKAWKRVKANKGAPGIDNMSIEAFFEFIRKNWDGIRESLLTGTYQSSPVQHVDALRGPEAQGQAFNISLNKVSSLKSTRIKARWH